MADANPSKIASKKEPKEVKETSAGRRIDYFGEGAEKVKFTVDPRATHIRVYADGRILTDY